MLVPNDILSAKLVVQLGLVAAEATREALRRLDDDSDPGRDLIAALVEQGALHQDEAELIRYYTALFVHLRREAILLRLVEYQHDLPRTEVLRLLARLELSSYRHHLSAVLQAVGHLSGEEAELLEGKTRRRIAREDRRVLERYREEGFRGVSRALIPAEPLTSDAFRLSSLFRTHETVHWVNKSKEQIREQERREREQPPELPPHPEREPGQALDDEETRVMIRPPETPADTRSTGSPSTGDTELELTRKLDDESGEGEPLESEPEDAWKSRWATDRIKEGHWSSSGEEAVDEQPVAAIGRYQVVECLGKGGMGAVYLCQDGPGLVAVKVMTAPESEDDYLRFAREGQICARLKHPNLIHLLDEGTSRGAPYLVLPVFAGQSLQERLDAKGPLLPREVFEVMEQALAGLGAAHRQRVVHRDIKPDNLFLLAGAQLTVKVIDFGIARFLDDLKPSAERAFRTELSVISGTPAFVAPETINSGSIDARTDIYSLGITFFVLLTGRHPLHAERSGDYLSEHLVGVPLTLSQAKRDAHWPEELELLLAAMMAKRPADRPSSCQNILAQLRGGLRDLTLSTLNDPPSRPSSRSARLRRLFNQFFKHER